MADAWTGGTRRALTGRACLGWGSSTMTGILAAGQDRLMDWPQELSARERPLPDVAALRSAVIAASSWPSER